MGRGMAIAVDVREIGNTVSDRNVRHFREGEKSGGVEAVESCERLEDEGEVG